MGSLTVGEKNRRSGEDPTILETDLLPHNQTKKRATRQNPEGGCDSEILAREEVS